MKQTRTLTVCLLLSVAIVAPSPSRASTPPDSGKPANTEPLSLWPLAGMDGTGNTDTAAPPSRFLSQSSFPNSFAPMDFDPTSPNNPASAPKTMPLWPKSPVPGSLPPQPEKPKTNPVPPAPGRAVAPPPGWPQPPAARGYGAAPGQPPAYVPSPASRGSSGWTGYRPPASGMGADNGNIWRGQAAAQPRGNWNNWNRWQPQPAPQPRTDWSGNPFGKQKNQPYANRFTNPWRLPGKATNGNPAAYGRPPAAGANPPYIRMPGPFAPQNPTGENRSTAPKRPAYPPRAPRAPYPYYGWGTPPFPGQGYANPGFGRPGYGGQWYGRQGYGTRGYGTQGYGGQGYSGFWR
jgi:hypothetical protein